MCQPNAGRNIVLVILGSASTVAPQSCDVTNMVIAKVEAEQRVAVAEKVAGKWEELAAYLAPALFTSNQVLVIRQENQYNRFVQAKTMLDVWSDQFGSQATCGGVVKGLLDMGCKAEAAEVFSHQLVEFVEQQQQPQQRQYRGTEV